jgi:hypothetical protein
LPWEFIYPFTTTATKAVSARKAHARIVDFLDGLQARSSSAQGSVAIQLENLAAALEQERGCHCSRFFASLTLYRQGAAKWTSSYRDVTETDEHWFYNSNDSLGYIMLAYSQDEAAMPTRV